MLVLADASGSIHCDETERGLVNMAEGCLPLLPCSQPALSITSCRSNTSNEGHLGVNLLARNVLFLIAYLCIIITIIIIVKIQLKDYC